MKYDGDTIEPVARAFVANLKRDLTADQMRDVIAKNRTRTPEDGWCATHDYLDANMTMLEAMSSVLGYSEDEVTDIMDAEDEVKANDMRLLWNAAWESAWTILDREGA